MGTAIGRLVAEENSAPVAVGEDEVRIEHTQVMSDDDTSVLQTSILCVLPVERSCAPGAPAVITGIGFAGAGAPLVAAVIAGLSERGEARVAMI